MKQPTINRAGGGAKIPFSVMHRNFLIMIFAASVAALSIFSETIMMGSFRNSNSILQSSNDNSKDKALSGGASSFLVDPLFQQQYDIIDGGNMTERCAKYGFTFNETLDQKHFDPNGTINSTQKSTGRRLFFGAMVADEGFDLIRMHATEVYGMYHVVALVESDKTHSTTRRKLRFTKGTPGYALLQSGIFGPQTQVYVDLFTGKAHEAYGMEREEIQRQAILERWKKAGMQPTDVGIMADMDETWTRDALHAGKHCDIPAFRPNQTCQQPRIRASTLIFEGSPECISLERLWYHPDFMIGECIEMIGNPRGRPTPVRDFEGVYGERVPGWGNKNAKDYSLEVLNNGSFPLANAADMRVGVENYAVQNFPKRMVSAYHFHNFFDSIDELRRKYVTYAHPNPRARSVTLSNIHSTDLDLMVRCVHNLNNSGLKADAKRYLDGFNAYTGPKPIFFLNETYRQHRHAALKLMIQDDERRHGSKYTASDLA